ncbi:MAG: M50 family metallopeptidase [Solirubrobacteraceae bacterium]|nr:MAG: hypothetical protein DLM63_13440 [Solirubrobacterales bacterium]
MRRGGSIQLARIAGVRVGADASWFITLFLFIFLLSAPFRDELGGSETKGYLAAVASALLLFGSVLLHELGHALTAKRMGAQVEGIELLFFGGFMRRSGDSQSAGEEFKVAAAGPLVTLVVAIVCVGIAIALDGPSKFSNGAGLSGSSAISPLLLVLDFLATMNIFLLALNIVPALPLDGGRMLRALIWWRTGNRTRATLVSGTIGRVFGYLLLGAGLAGVLGGYFAAGIWALFIGFMIAGNARAAILQATIAERLDGVTVSEIMDAEPVAMEAQTTALSAADEYFARYRYEWFPVVDEAGCLLGRVRQERVDAAVAAGTPALSVSDLLDEEPVGALRIAPGASLDVLVGSETLRRLGALCAVDGDGVLRGIVTVDHVRRALQAAAMR